MTKKNYQALAGALYRERASWGASTMSRVITRDWAWRGVVNALSDVLAADNPRFDRECFVAACEDGNVGRRPKRKRAAEPESDPNPPCRNCGSPTDDGEGWDGLCGNCADRLPLCVRAMRCYCAGHARGNPASEPCDTREGA